MLATEIFSGAYRGNGKPFVCHSVGTASVVAETGLGIVPVLAGLLHAAFDLGVFPDGGRGDSRAHQALVAGRAGQDVVDLILAYHSFPFGGEAVERYLLLPPSDEPAKTVALLRLANQVDDMLDEGLSVTQKHADLALRARNCAQLARLFGQEELAVTIERLAAADGPAPWVAALEPVPRFTYRLVPRLRAYLRLRRRRGTRLIG
jgi:hypothetical protein